MMQMTQQLMGGGLATPQAGGAAPPAVPSATPPAAPATANPMANLMQMMGGGQQPFGGGFGGGAGFGAAPGIGGAAPARQDNPMAAQMQRVRFASQLQQLMAMGFADEAVCLR